MNHWPPCSGPQRAAWVIPRPGQVATLAVRPSLRRRCRPPRPRTSTCQGFCPSRRPAGLGPTAHPRSGRQGAGLRGALLRQPPSIFLRGLGTGWRASAANHSRDLPGSAGSGCASGASWGRCTSKGPRQLATKSPLRARPPLCCHSGTIRLRLLVSGVEDTATFRVHVARGRAELFQGPVSASALALALSLGLRLQVVGARLAR